MRCVEGGGLGGAAQLLTLDVSGTLWYSCRVLKKKKRKERTGLTITTQRRGRAGGTGVSELPVRVAPLAGLPFCRSV